MEMTGECRISASRQQVWDALNDVDILGQSIPGCESIERISDTQLTAQVTAKVGPVKAKFAGHVTLSDLDPPNAYTLSGEGKGGVAGFAKGAANVRLSNDGGDTVLTYAVNAQVGGKLAQVGARLIDATAKKLADEFFSTFSELAASQPVPAEVSERISALPEKRWNNSVVWVAMATAVALIFYWFFSRAG